MVNNKIFILFFCIICSSFINVNLVYSVPVINIIKTVIKSSIPAPYVILGYLIITKIGYNFWSQYKQKIKDLDTAIEESAQIINELSNQIKLLDEELSKKNS